MVVSLATNDEKNTAVIPGGVSVILSVLPTLSHFFFCVCHRQNKCLTAVVVTVVTVMVSTPDRLQWTLPQKTAFIPAVTESYSAQFTDGDYVINSEKSNFVTFLDVWWVRISITTHYNSIHMNKQKWRIGKPPSVEIMWVSNQQPSDY